VYISHLIEEMILASHGKDLPPEGSTPSELGRDFNGQPLFKWIHDEGYLLYYFGSNEKSLWAEWDLLESIFQTVDSLYPEWTLKALSQRSSSGMASDDSIYQLL
jgi:hypothetical protein